MSPTASPTLFALCALALTACTQFPVLDHTQTGDLESAAYPSLVPIEPILARAAGPRPDPVREEANLNARLNALRARADRMRRTVLTGPEKQRLESGLK